MIIWIFYFVRATIPVLGEPVDWHYSTLILVRYYFMREDISGQVLAATAVR